MVKAAALLFGLLSLLALSVSAADRMCSLVVGTEVSAKVQSCISEAAEGDRIFFKPGRYFVGKTIEVVKPVQLLTASNSEAQKIPCAFNETHHCAEFQAMPNFFPNPGEGIFSIKAPKVTVAHIVINGAKATRAASAAGKECSKGNNAHGYSFSVFANEFTAIGVTSKNALCATGFFAAKGVSKFSLTRSFIGNNGLHNVHGMWADGVTIHDMADSVISHNVFFNNTDIDLIFGGCQNCLIENNLIKHDASFAGSAFAGLMLHAWPNATSGDFTGTLTRNNLIDCGPKRCGFGIYLGAEAWYSAPLFGGIVENNEIRGAMLGLNVDRSTGPVSLRSNIVKDSGGRRRYLTSCGQRSMGGYNISPDSQVDLSQDKVAKSLYSREKWTGCIPNWWTEDSTL